MYGPGELMYYHLTTSSLAVLMVTFALELVAQHKADVDREPPLAVILTELPFQPEISMVWAKFLESLNEAYHKKGAMAVLPTYPVDAY